MQAKSTLTGSKRDENGEVDKALQLLESLSEFGIGNPGP